MAKPKYFKNIPLLIFFPDATRAVLKTLDMPIPKLLGYFHLYKDLGKRVIRENKEVLFNFNGLPAQAGKLRL